MLLWSSEGATTMPDEALVFVILGSFTHLRCIPTRLRSHASGCELARGCAQFRTPLRPTPNGAQSRSGKAVTTSGDLPVKELHMSIYSFAPSCNLVKPPRSAYKTKESPFLSTHFSVLVCSIYRTLLAIRQPSSSPPAINLGLIFLSLEMLRSLCSR